MTTLKGVLAGTIAALVMQTTLIEFAKDVYLSWAGCDTITECKQPESD